MVAIDVFVKCLAKTPSTVSGDAFWYTEDGPRLWTAVVDGLGYGLPAAEAAGVAIASLAQAVEQLSGENEPLDPETALPDILRGCDKRLRQTRGAALGLALFDAERGAGVFAGVGNIELRVLGPIDQAHPICMPGIVGAGLTRVHLERFPYSPGQLILMHSDGLSSHFDMSPHFVTQALDEIGEALIATHAKKDDLTLLLVRQHA